MMLTSNLRLRKLKTLASVATEQQLVSSEAFEQDVMVLSVILDAMVFSNDAAAGQFGTYTLALQYNVARNRQQGIEWATSSLGLT